MYNNYIRSAIARCLSNKVQDMICENLLLVDTPDPMFTSVRARLDSELQCSAPLLDWIYIIIKVDKYTFHLELQRDWDRGAKALLGRLIG